MSQTTQITLKDDIRRVTVETDVPVDVLSNLVTRIAVVVEALNAAVPLIRFKAIRTAPLKYDYEFDTADGRSWKQKISFSNGVRMTFNVGADPDVDGWELPEFIPHRAIRDEIFVPLVRDYNIAVLKVKYLAYGDGD